MTTQTMKLENALSTQSKASSQTGDYVGFYGGKLINGSVKNSKPCRIFDIEANKAPTSPNPSFSEFDKILFSLEEDQETAKKLSEARNWVANEFYADKLTMASLRLSAGLSQFNLGKACGIEQSHVSRYESGRHEPSITQSVKLAKALNVDVETFFEAWSNSRKINQSGVNHD
jgi:DNA-binding XRE family transcriptional regulator